MITSVVISLLTFFGLLTENQAVLRLQVTGYSSTIATYTVQNDVLQSEQEFDLGPLRDMTWMQLDGGFLYGAHEVGEMEGEAGGAVSRWIMGEGAELELQEWRTIGSTYPAHMLVSSEHGMIYTANYGGSSFSALRLGPGGEVGDVVRVDNFPFEEEEECRDASHPHQTVIRGDWIWVVDLGCDRIRHYRKSDSGPKPLFNTHIAPGAGPRHLVLHPSLNIAYLACELQSRVQVYSVRSETSGLSLLQELPFSSTNGDSGAEILIQGDFVYATSRGSGVVLVYRMDPESGLLTLVQEEKLGGTWPRSLVVRGNIGAVIDQKGDSLQLLHIDEATGMVTPGATVATPSGPAFVQFVE